MFILPVTESCLRTSSSSCKLSDLEVVMEPFHHQLLSFLSPSHLPVTLHQNVLCSPSPSASPSLSPSPSPSSSLSTSPSPPLPKSFLLRYVTSAQLQSVLDKEKSSERDLNSKSGVEELVISRLGTELEPLLGSTDSLHSDLIPAIYEGGMKVWECAYDLVDYLASGDSPNLSGRHVLELGCGVGLPGIFALLSGAETVHFHDYNREVLSCLTIPSLLASFVSAQPDSISGQTGQTGILDRLVDKTRFFFGDWADFAMSHCVSGEPPYDIILTSETIYSALSQPKLLQALKKLTNQSTGLVVMAAKTHYFGVGGSVAMFRDLVARDGHFEMTVVKNIEATVPRVILLLKPRL